MVATVVAGTIEVLNTRSSVGVPALLPGSSPGPKATHLLAAETEWNLYGAHVLVMALVPI